MAFHLAAAGAFFTLLLAIVLIYSDELLRWKTQGGDYREGSHSPCKCLTGIFADNSLFGALHRRNLFLGIHWRVTPAYVADFLDPWELKYNNLLSVHKLKLPIVENDDDNNNNSAVVLDALRAWLEKDLASEGDDTWMVRDSHLMASSRRRHMSSKAQSHIREPVCHVWILPETASLPSEVWVAMKGLLEEGTLADMPLRLPSNNINAWRRYQPLGVLLWADPADRESLKSVVPPRTVMMFTTIDG